MAVKALWRKRLGRKPLNPVPGLYLALSSQIFGLCHGRVPI